MTFLYMPRQHVTLRTYAKVACYFALFSFWRDVVRTLCLRVCGAGVNANGTGHFSTQKQMSQARRTTEYRRCCFSNQSAQVIQLISWKELAMATRFKLENCAKKRPTRPTVDGRWNAEQIPRAGPKRTNQINHSSQTNRKNHRRAKHFYCHMCVAPGDVVLQPLRPGVASCAKTSKYHVARQTAALTTLQAKVAPQTRKVIQKAGARKYERLRFLKEVPSEAASHHGSAKKQKTVLEILLTSAAAQRPSETSFQPISEPRQTIGGQEPYIDEMKQERVSGLKISGPWVRPRDAFAEAAAINAQRHQQGERNLDAAELLNLMLRPSIFIWDPANIFPELKISCPTCGSPASRAGWCRPKTLHHLYGQSVYVTMRYRCRSCGAKDKSQARSMQRFLLDAPEVLASFPKPVSAAWRFACTGRILCDAAVVDFVRSMATRTSWSAMADAINEMKTTAWCREVEIPYLRLCQLMRAEPLRQKLAFPKELLLSSDWVRTLYLTDAARRAPHLQRELFAEVGDDVLRIDWTEGAASRTGGAYLLNVMDGCGIILLTRLTSTCKPMEAKGVFEELFARGVRPKVAYVDDECCGTWVLILRDIWPEVQVKLDAMHALRRVTQTVASTRHPWHGQFCAMLAEAVYTDDTCVMGCLRRARAREGHHGPVPNSTSAKYVPRHISDARKIAQSMGEIIESFSTKVHPDAGALLTSETRRAWANLKVHILKDCLCDPCGCPIHKFAEEAVTIGGEDFQRLRVLRGTSPLEGFHAHQKQWLGTFARHAEEAGQALLNDGAARWNRKRRSEGGRCNYLFAGDLMDSVDELSQDAPSELVAQITASG